MAIPNPNPNIEDGAKMDNKTWSSNYISGKIQEATELPVVTSEDNGKVLTVSSGAWAADYPGIDLIDDSTTSESKVWSSDKTADEISDAAEAVNANFSDAYDSTATYAVGDLCIYEGALYKCNTTISTAEDWTAAHWTATNIDSELATKQDSDILNIKTTFESGTGITSAIASLINTYGKKTMIYSAVITGYGWISGMMTFYDNSQGGGYVIANNKGKGGDNPVLYSVQYVNGTVTLGYPWVDPNS